MYSRKIQKRRRISSRLTKYKRLVRALMRGEILRHNGNAPTKTIMLRHNGNAPMHPGNFRLTVKVLASKIEISRSAVTDLAAL